MKCCQADLRLAGLTYRGQVLSHKGMEQQAKKSTVGNPPTMHSFKSQTTLENG